MNCVKSGNEKSGTANDAGLNVRDRTVRDGGGDRPGMPGAWPCSWKPHCALHTSSAKMASLDHSLAS